MECQCNNCQAACTFKPGWFLPGEAEKAAKLLNMSLQEFFCEYLGVDWWEDTDDIFVLAPALTSMIPGEEYPARPTGTCVFYGEDGLCKIHEAKPHECRELDHESTQDQIHNRHKATGLAWKNDQKQIEELLERMPHSSNYNPFAWFDDEDSD